MGNKKQNRANKENGALSVAKRKIEKLEEELKKEKERNQDLVSKNERIQQEIFVKIEAEIEIKRSNRSLNLDISSARVEIKNIQDKLQANQSELLYAKFQAEKSTSCNYRESFSKLQNYQRKQTRSSNCVKVMVEEGAEEDIKPIFTYIAGHYKRPNGQYMFKLSDMDSLLFKNIFHLGDEAVKHIKQFFFDRFGIDIICSRMIITMLEKQLDTSRFYEIGVEIVIINKKRVQRFYWICRNYEAVLSIRLTDLCNAGRLGSTPLKIIKVVASGDKGDEEVKFLVGIEHPDRPNSPYALTNIVTFSGQDNFVNIKAKLGSAFEMIQNVTEIEYKYGNEVRRSIVDTKWTGDFKFISGGYAHRGQSCKNPCVSCECPLTTHGAFRDFLASYDFTQKFEARTIARMISQCEDGTVGMILGEEPVCKIEPKKLVPPSVHTMNGIFEKFVYKPTIARSNGVDLDYDIPDTLEEQKRDLRDLARDEKDLEHVICENQQYMHTAKLMLEGLINNQPSAERNCAATCCIIDYSSENVATWVCCDVCQKDYHQFCAFIITEEQKCHLNNPNSEWKCWKCDEDEHEILKMLEEAIQDFDEELKRDNDMLLEIQDERKQKEQVIILSQGSHNKELEDVFRKIGCMNTIWYSQLVGNQIRAFLRPESIDMVLNLFPQDHTTHLMRKSMLLLGRIMTFSGLEYFEDEDIVIFKTCVYDFVDVLKELFPNQAVTPKLHFLVYHVVPYVEENRTWGGCISEQSTEHYHVIYRKVKRIFQSVRNLQFRAALMLRRFAEFNHMHDIGAI